MTSMGDLPRNETGRRLFDESGEALVLFEPGSGRLLDANRAAYRLMGYGAAAVRSLTLGALFKGLGPEGLARLGSVGENGGWQRLDYDVFLRRPGGEVTPVRVSASRARAAPAPVGLLCVHHAESGCEEALERFLDLADDLCPCCVVGLDGCFHAVNAAWQACLGYRAEEFSNAPVARFLHPEERDQALLVSDTQVRGEHRFVHRNGSERRLAWRATFAGGLVGRQS